jgi:hypothetical protein
MRRAGGSESEDHDEGGVRDGGGDLGVGVGLGSEDGTMTTGVRVRMVWMYD